MKSFYYGQGDPKFNIVMSIMGWVDKKEITNSLNNNNASSANNNNENNMGSEKELPFTVQGPVESMILFHFVFYSSL